MNEIAFSAREGPRNVVGIVLMPVGPWAGPGPEPKLVLEPELEWEAWRHELMRDLELVERAMASALGVRTLPRSLRFHDEALWSVKSPVCGLGGLFDEQPRPRSPFEVLGRALASLEELEKRYH